MWLNGREVGYTQDWALPAEFELTGLLAASSSRRRHVLSVQVLRWCDGCYLEGQDHWWLSGIHRHVRLYSKPVDTAAALASGSTPRPPLPQPRASALPLLLDSGPSPFEATRQPSSGPRKADDLRSDPRTGIASRAPSRSATTPRARPAWRPTAPPPR